MNKNMSILYNLKIRIIILNYRILYGHGIHKINIIFYLRFFNKQIK